MRHISSLLLTSLCLLSFVGYSQPKDDISFFISKLKTNYAGFRDKAPAGEFDNFVKKVLKEDGTDTFRILSRLAHFFKDNHVILYEMNSLKYQDTLLAPGNLKKVNAYFSDSKVKKGIHEGYWLDDFNSVIVAIIRSKQQAGRYEIYLIETIYNAVPKGMLIGKMEAKGGNNYFTRYISPGTGNSSFLDTKFRNDSLLVLAEHTKLRKLENYNPANPVLPGLTPFRFVNSGRSLDKDNYLLTIPDFSYNIGSIDSIIKKDSAKIYAAKTMILDLRNNAGGSVLAYQPLLPFIYTNPIKEVNGMILASDDLINDYKETLEQELNAEKLDSASVKELQMLLPLLEKGRGGLVETPAPPMKSGVVMALPKNVGVIINYACQSAAELFLLNFKQSKKVTLFGENTFGAVDYLNATFTYSPSGRYFFSIATAKRAIAAGDSKIDGTGIAPDVPISDTVKDWVDFVKKYYQNGAQKNTQ